MELDDTAGKHTGRRALGLVAVAVIVAGWVDVIATARRTYREKDPS